MPNDDAGPVEAGPAAPRRGTVAMDALIDARGHWRRPAPFRRGEMEYGRRFDHDIAMARMIPSLAGLHPDDPAKVAEITRLFFETSECHVCAGRFGFHASEDGLRYTASTECPHPDGIAFEVLVAVPSGRIAFANDLRELSVIEEPSLSVNYMLGQRMLTEAYAATGLVMVATGNTCPGIHQFDEGSLAVANYAGPDDEGFDPDEFETLGVVTPVGERGTRIGSICTDLWDFCAMDHDLFLARCGELGLDPGGFGVDVATVRPGTYAFSVPADTGRDTATEIYARIAWTDREAPPIVLVDTGLAETLQASHAYREVSRMAEGGTLFESALSLLTVCGNGYAWTDGFLRDGSRRRDRPFRTMAEGDPETHSLVDAIPLVPYRPRAYEQFGRTRVHHVYPISRGYAHLLTVPGNVDPWWLALCLVVARGLSEAPDAFDPARDREGAALLVRQALAYLLAVVEVRGGIDRAGPYLEAWAGALRTDARGDADA